MTMKADCHLTINGWTITGWPAFFAILALWFLPAALVAVVLAR